MACGRPPSELDLRLHAACRAVPTDRAEVARLLDEGADPNVRAFAPHGLFAGEVPPLLAHAPRRAPDPDLEVVRLLLARGADVDARDRQGRTALILAASYGHTELARLLLDAGADPDALSRDPSHATPLGSAAAGHPEWGLATARLLLERGARADLPCEVDGETPLHKAVHRGVAPIVELVAAACPALDAFHVPPGAAFAPGRTALQHGVWLGAPPEVLEALVRAGARPDARGQGGNSAMREAALRRELAAVDLMLRLGASIDLRDDHGATPLAAVLALPGPLPAGFVAGLLDRGADANATDLRGATLLHRAVTTRRADVVRLLLARGADPARRDQEGRTPLDLARALGAAVVAAELGGGPAGPDEPSALGLALLRDGVAFEHDGERLEETGHGLRHALATQPHRTERWSEEEARERLAWLLLRDPAASAAVEAWLAAGRARLGLPAWAPGEAARRVRELEPELARRAALDPTPADAGRAIEAHLRAGGSLYSSDKEGCSEWRFDGGLFLHRCQGDHGPDRDLDAAQFVATMACGFTPERGLLRSWDDRDLRAALRALGQPTLRAWLLR